MQVLIAAGLVAGVSAAIMTYVTNNNKEVSQYNKVQDLELFTKAVQNIVGDQNSCYGTVLGAPRVDINSAANPTTDIEGLLFIPSSGGAPSRTSFSANTNKQSVVLGSNFKSGANNLRIQNGQVFNDFDLTVVDFYLADKSLFSENASEAKYKANLYLQAKPTGSDQNLAPRLVSTLTLSFSKTLNPGSLTLTGCLGELSAQLLCQQMGCNYNATAANQKCICGYPDMACPSGQYVSSYNPTTNAPVCKAIELNCLTTKGPGYFLAGVDSYGFPICVALENPQATNVTCGSSNGQTLASAPSSNLCNNGSLSGSVNGTGPWTWDCAGTGGPVSCSANKTAAVVNGSCGSANGTSPASAPTTNLCSAGTETAVSGSGPYTWSCNGSNGGTNASCSTTAPITNYWVIVGGCGNNCVGGGFCATGNMNGQISNPCTSQKIINKGYATNVVGSVSGDGAYIITGVSCTVGSKGHWVNPTPGNNYVDVAATECQNYTPCSGFFCGGGPNLGP